MLNKIDEILHTFRPCFSRYATFCWFVIFMVGLMVRLDHEGLTSIVRWLALIPEASYYSLVNFCHSSAWELSSLLTHWTNWAMAQCPVVEFNDRPLLLGDGILVGKEGRRMPGVKKLYQDSNNNSKKEYIFGHHFGYVGVLIGSLSHAFCLPLEGAIHEGVDDLRPEEGLNGQKPTLVTRMANLLVKAAKATGRCCYATLDRYFAVGPTFLLLKAQVNEHGQQWVHIITKAKSNYVAFYPAKDKKEFKKENKVYLMEIFDHLPYLKLFKTAKVQMGGELRTVSYYAADLLWAPVKGFIRFVWVKDGDYSYVLMGSDLKLDPVTMISIYSYRSKIEVMFSALIYFIGAFSYHFWSKAFPKQKRTDQLEYDKLTEKEQEKIKKALTAAERFVNLAAIVLGIFQYLSLTATNEIWNGNHGWFRTYSSSHPSERIVQNVVKNEFYHNQHKVLQNRTLQIINEKKQKIPKPQDLKP